MPISTLAQVLDLKTEADFKQSVNDFEVGIHSTLKLLDDRLAQQVRSPEVQQLEMHMAFVESWRDRVCKMLMLAEALVYRGKSHHFLLPGGKNVTTTDREAYQKDIVGSISAAQTYLENKIKSIDSRVNLCKILLRSEVEGSMNSRRF